MFKFSFCCFIVVFVYIVSVLAVIVSFIVVFFVYCVLLECVSNSCNVFYLCVVSYHVTTATGLKPICS
jgi:predicted neutral ceramidase superfamily lipid hydrolase